MRSTLGVTGALDLIADEAGERPALARWLSDMSHRCAPFVDFDIRGLSEYDRIVFWSAAERALKALAEKWGPGFLEIENMWSGNVLNDLLEMRKRILAGEPASKLSDFKVVFKFDGQPIDLNELWFDGDESVDTAE